MVAEATASTPTSLVTGFERFAIWTTAGCFQIGSGGQPLFYLRRSGRAFVLPTRRHWRRLRTVIAMCLLLVMLAWTSSTAGHPFLSILKLMTIPPMFLISWLNLRGLPRISEPFRSEDADHVRRVVMDGSLALALIEVGAGWALVSSLLNHFGLDTAPLGVIAGGLIVDGARRLLQRKPLPPGVLLE